MTADGRETAMFKSVCVASLLLLTSGMAVSAAPKAGAASDRSLPRVRPNDGRSATLLLRGIERSETIRRLVDKLETMDVIVYVEMQPALNRQLGGRLVWLTAAGSFRYVRVSLNPDLSLEALIATLGHELQHAAEVASAPSIVDEASLETFYRKAGINVRSHDSGWDTQAARDTGDRVRKELANAPVVRVAASAPAFDPLQWHLVYLQAREKFGH
jgi:hypothetical protein